LLDLQNAYNQLVSW